MIALVPEPLATPEGARAAPPTSNARGGRSGRRGATRAERGGTDGEMVRQWRNGMARKYAGARHHVRPAAAAEIRCAFDAWQWGSKSTAQNMSSPPREIARLLDCTCCLTHRQHHRGTRAPTTNSNNGAEGGSGRKEEGRTRGAARNGMRRGCVERRRVRTGGADSSMA